MVVSATHELNIRPIEDQGTWELFVLTHGPNALFQSWSWYETLRDTKARVQTYGVYQQDQLIAVFLSHIVIARRGSFVHVRHGPILSSSAPISTWQKIADFTKILAKENRCWFIRMSPQLPIGKASDDIRTLLGGIPASIHRMDGEYCWVLDLIPTEEELLQSMRKATRYEIRRAQKEGVVVVGSRDVKFYKEFEKLYRATSDRHGFVPHEGIREEFVIFSKRNQATMYLGTYQKKVYVASIVLYYGKQAIYHHGASINSTVPISAAVQWKAICEAKERGMNVYNFWGIAPEHSIKHPWRGITVFKKGFGGRIVEYMHAFDIPVSPMYAFTRLVDVYRKYRRGYD